jgi:hypothetical protein
MRLGTRRGVIAAMALAAGLCSRRGVPLGEQPVPPHDPQGDRGQRHPHGRADDGPADPLRPLQQDRAPAQGPRARAGSVHGLLGKAPGSGSGLCGSCGGKGCGSCKGPASSAAMAGLQGDGRGHGTVARSDWQAGRRLRRRGCGGLGRARPWQAVQGCGLCGGAGCGVCESSILPRRRAGRCRSRRPGSSPCGVEGCGLGTATSTGRATLQLRPRRSTGLATLRHGAAGGVRNCGGGGGHGLGHAGRRRGLQGLRRGRLRPLRQARRGKLGLAKGMAYGLLHPHAGKIEYFVGPAAPCRSPRAMSPTST